MDPDIKTSIETAEEELGTGALDKAEKSLRDAIEKLKSSSWSPSLFSMSIALRLVKGLRQLSNGKEKGTIELAQEVLTQGLNKYPFEPKLLNEQAQLYCDTKKYDKAVESFENAILQESIDKDEKFAALVGKATALRHLRHFKKAEDTLQQALALDGASPKFLIEQGWLHFYGKRYAAAFSAFKKAFDASVEVDKHQARVAMLSARQALDITAPFDDTRSAKALMSQWFNNGVTVPQASRIYLDCSAVLEELNLYPAALNNVEQLLEIDEGNLKGWCLKISALKWLRRFGEAEKAYREAQARWPRSVEVWKEMSNLYYEEKRFRQAYLQDSGEAVKESPISESDKQALAATLEQDDEAKEWAIVSLRKMRQFSEAQIKVDEVLATQPNNVNFLCEKAFIYYSERHYDQAIEFFRRALQVSDYDKFARKWLIASLRKKAAAEVSGGAAPDFSEAKRELDEALTKLSYDTGIWEESAWLAFDEGNLEQALKDFDQAIDLDPYLIHKQFSKIEILARLNRWDEALNVFQTLEKKFPNDAEVDEQLCWFYLRLGEPQLAKEQWKKIKKYHPNNVLGFNAQGGYELAHRNYEAAEEAFRKAIAKVDYEPQYYINLGWALVRQIKSPGELANLDLPKREKLFQEAKNNCWKALELDPYSSKAYGCLGS